MIHAGLTLGITTETNCRQVDAPSTLAASSSASGSWDINCFIRYSPSVPDMAGRITAQTVSIRCSELSTTYWGIYVTSYTNSSASVTPVS